MDERTTSEYDRCSPDRKLSFVKDIKDIGDDQFMTLNLLPILTDLRLLDFFWNLATRETQKRLVENKRHSNAHLPLVSFSP